MNSIEIHQATSTFNLTKDTTKGHTNTHQKSSPTFPGKANSNEIRFDYLLCEKQPCHFVIFGGKNQAPGFSFKMCPQQPSYQAPSHLCWCWYILVVRATGIGVLATNDGWTKMDGLFGTKMRKFP